VTERTTLPAHVVREAAELLVSYGHLKRFMGGEAGAGPSIKDFLERLAAARGDDQLLAYTKPHPGFKRPLTVLARSYHGAYRACVLPGRISPDLAASQFLDKADSGLLGRDEAWGDPRYIGTLQWAIHPDGRSPWWSAHPLRGVAARAAWAAHSFADELRAGARLEKRTVHEFLFRRERQVKESGLTARFSDNEDPFEECWTVDQLRRIIEEVEVVKLPARGRMDFPLQVLRYRGKLGYGALIAFWLTLDVRGPGMSQSEAAAAMSLDDRKSASALARAAQRKLAPRISITQLVPPFPAPDLPEPTPKRPSEAPRRQQT
jgi:hypothetical protein